MFTIALCDQPSRLQPGKHPVTRTPPRGRKVLGSFASGGGARDGSRLCRDDAGDEL